MKRITKALPGNGPQEQCLQPKLSFIEREFVPKTRNRAIPVFLIHSK